MDALANKTFTCYFSVIPSAIMGFDDKGVNLSLSDPSLPLRRPEIISIPTSTNDAWWHHQCLKWASDNGGWAVYVDGALIAEGEGYERGQLITSE